MTPILELISENGKMSFCIEAISWSPVRLTRAPGLSSRSNLNTTGRVLTSIPTRWAVFPPFLPVYTVAWQASSVQLNLDSAYPIADWKNAFSVVPADSTNAFIFSGGTSSFDLRWPLIFFSP